MKTIDVTVGLKIFLLGFIIFIIGIGCYSYFYSQTYNSIVVSVSKNNKLECGNTNYNIYDLIDNVSGEIVSISKDIDINQVGEQEVVLNVSKNNIVRKVPIIVEVVDTSMPVINLKEEVINVNSNTSYDIYSNILDVTDDFDGSLKYMDSSLIDGDSNGYYTVNGVLNTNIVGSNSIEVKAVDKAGNITTKNFTVNVTSHGKEENIKNIAYSLLGSPYASGGASPSGFDCSGFVQYVYRCVGLSVSRSAGTQLYDGYEVLYENIRIGDIIVWGYDNEHITHTAIYVGNGLMIHAANPSEGVVVNQVSNWGTCTGIDIVSVRRLS